MRTIESRRRFLQFLATSPLLTRHARSAVLARPEDALNVTDFEEAARQKVPTAHFGYMATGVDDENTLRANHEAYSRIKLRPRRLVDTSKIDTHTEIFGATWDWPIFICPAGSQRAFHADGELATARAARAKKSLMALSTVSSNSVEDVNREYGSHVWYQLYITNKWEVTERLVKRAEDAGCPVLLWTVDLLAGSNRETAARSRRLDTRDCTTCHGADSPSSLRRRPMFNGIDVTGVNLGNPNMTWDTVGKLKKLTRMKVVLKGIETREDAELCCQNGADGIIVSNHGGRADESGRGTIECLPEVIEAVRGRIPVMIDGGIRRGTDVFKALALGARAVGIGRPYLWGLGAFGQPGVERVLDLLRNEFALAMRQYGTRSLSEIGRNSVIL